MPGIGVGVGVGFGGGRGTPPLTLPDIPRANLISEYPVIKQGGMIRDYAGDSHLEIKGSPVFLDGMGANWGPGDYATRSALDLGSNQKQTLIAVTTVPTTSEKGVLYYSGDGGLAIGLGALAMDTNGNNVLCLYEGSAWKVGAAVGTGTMMLSVAVNGGTANFYKNTSLLVSRVGGTIGFAGTVDTIGSSSGPRQLSGVDVFYILRYDDQLSAAKITEIYNGFVSYGLL